MLLAPNPSDAEGKQKRDDLSFRTALGDDYDSILRRHRTGRETDICGSFFFLFLFSFRFFSLTYGPLLSSGKLRVLQLLLRKWKVEGHKVPPLPCLPSYNATCVDHIVL
jgi:hypothetical protein